MRALVIDDSRSVRAIIGNMLRENGIEVQEAANGREGLDQLECSAGIELVLVDWNMPVMDGLEFIQAVRAQRIYDSVPIVMVTTEADHTQVMRAMQAGANEYVMKPFTKEILAAKLSLLDAFGV
jgi:two-component system, chemotaxis family, chemotaxis protein CheY